jgi:ABC-type phosphate/phosphonate transport system substrate-binding protein
MLAVFFLLWCSNLQVSDSQGRANQKSALKVGVGKEQNSKEKENILHGSLRAYCMALKIYLD